MPIARPRSVSDDVILDATRQVLTEFGPGSLTLAAVGARAGLAPPTLMQRFGSKRRLLLAVAAHSPVLVSRAAEEAERRNSSPLPALRDFVLSVVAHLEHWEVVDAEFRQYAMACSETFVEGCARLCRAAVEAGELRADTDVPALASHLLICCHGALQVWAVNGSGSLPELLTEQFDSAIMPRATVST